MRFVSSDDAQDAMRAAGIEPAVLSPGVWKGSVKVPDDLDFLDAVILSDQTSDSAKVFAGTLLALVADRTVDGVFAFTVSAESQAAGATQNGE